MKARIPVGGRVSLLHACSCSYMFVRKRIRKLLTQGTEQTHRQERLQLTQIPKPCSVSMTWYVPKQLMVGSIFRILNCGLQPPSPSSPDETNSAKRGKVQRKDGVRTEGKGLSRAHSKLKAAAAVIGLAAAQRRSPTPAKAAQNQLGTFDTNTLQEARKRGSAEASSPVRLWRPKVGFWVGVLIFFLLSF